MNELCESCGYVYSERFAWCPDCGTRPTNSNASTQRKVKPYPAVPADPPPIEYVPTWRDYLPDLARAMLYAAVVAAASIAATVLVLSAK